MIGNDPAAVPAASPTEPPTDASDVPPARASKPSRRRVQWYNDGQAGGPSSEQTLMTWFSNPKNVDRWDGSAGTGESKEMLCNEVVGLLKQNGIHYRTSADVRDKIRQQLSQYGQTREWMLHGRGAQVRADLGDTLFQGVLNQRCRNWSLLHPVLKHRNVTEAGSIIPHGTHRSDVPPGIPSPMTELSQPLAPPQTAAVAASMTSANPWMYSIAAHLATPAPIPPPHRPGHARSAPNSAESIPTQESPSPASIQEPSNEQQPQPQPHHQSPEPMEGVQDGTPSSSNSNVVTTTDQASAAAAAAVAAAAVNNLMHMELNQLHGTSTPADLNQWLDPTAHMSDSVNSNGRKRKRSLLGNVSSSTPDSSAMMTRPTPLLASLPPEILHNYLERRLAFEIQAHHDLMRIRERELAVAEARLALETDKFKAAQSSTSSLVPNPSAE